MYNPTLDLHDIGKLYGTDKSGKHNNYCNLYHTIMRAYRECKIAIIEIGVEKGNSIKMWLDYFRDAIIIGIDKGVEHDIGNDRFIFIKGNQTDEETLKSAVDACNGYPLAFVIDDGSHIVDHQRVSMDFLWKYLASGGTYFIEDLTARRTQYSEVMFSLLMRFWTTREFYNQQIIDETDDIRLESNGALGILRKKGTLIVL